MSKALIAGLVIGGLLVVSVPVIGIVAAIAIPSLLAARRAANESAAVGNLRTIGSAEATYLSETGKTATLAELKKMNLLDASWADKAVRDGYVIRQVSVDPDDQTFEFAAEPSSGSNGTRSYNITEDFVIRYASGAMAPKGTAGKQIGS
jgi:type IV pilus assembly protein PilA